MAWPHWTDEHHQLRRTVRDYVERELAPNAGEWDKQQSFPRHIFRDLAELGVLGIRFDPDYGGMGLDWWFSVCWIEELMRCRNSGVAMSLLVDTDMATPIINEIGTPEQKEEFLAPVITGEKVAALGVTEPNCGSDVAAIQTTARKDGSDYVINGQKTYITNGAFADFITLAVRTGDPGMGGISLVLFPTDTPGFTVGRKLDKLGTRSVDSCELHFQDCRIPQRNVLGHENMGFLYIMQNFQGERLTAALMATAGMDIQMRSAIKYGQEREAFGRPIMSMQLWKYRMADHKASLEAARALTYRATDVINSDADPLEIARWVTMAKLYAGDLAQKVVYDCLQLYGGYGYIEEYDIARAYRDTRLMTIGGGTTEIMQKLLAKLEGW